MLAAVAAVALVVGSAEQLGQLRRDLPWAIFYARQLGPDRRRHPLLRGRPAAAAAPVEPGDRGAVLPRVAAGVPRPRPLAPDPRRRWPAVVAAVAVVAMVLMAWLQLGGPGSASTCSAASTASTSCTCRRSRGPADCCSAPRPPSSGARGGCPRRSTAGRLDTAGGVARRRAGVHRRRRQPDGRLRLPVAAAARVGAVARGRARRGPPGGPRDAPRARPHARWSRSASAATACTSGTGRSSCCSTPPTARPAASSSRSPSPWSSPSCRTATSRRRCATAPSPAGGGRPARPGRGRRSPSVATVVVLAGCYVAVDPYDRAAGGEDGDVRGARRSARRSPLAAAASRRRRPPRRPRRLVIVGDSQAHSLAINLPDGIEGTFTIEDGSLDGCSVYDAGRVRSSADELRQLLRHVRRLAAGLVVGGAHRPAPRSPSSCSARGTCSTWRPATARG